MKIHSVTQIIEIIGRPRLREIARVKDSAIDNAKADGICPASWFGPIEAEFGEGVELPRSLFRFKKPIKQKSPSTVTPLTQEVLK